MYLVASRCLTCMLSWLTSMLALKQGNVTLCLAVLTPLAEEVDALQHIKRQAVVPALIHSSQSVFRLLGSLVTGIARHDGSQKFMQVYAMPS